MAIFLSSPYHLEDILSSKDAKATKQVIANSVRTMNEYLSAKNGQLKTIEDLDSADTPDVVAVLRKCYVEVRKTDGSLYALKSFSSIRYGLQRHLLETRKGDFVHDKSYDEANTIFKAMLVHLKKKGKGTVYHKDPISREDMQKLYSHDNFSLSSLIHCRVYVLFLQSGT